MIALAANGSGAIAAPTAGPDRGPSDILSPCPGPASAREAFERTWVAVRGYFGAAGMPPPRVEFPDKPYMEMQVSGTVGGYRHVQVMSGEREALTGRRGCHEALAAREALVHEFVHIFQAEPWGSGEMHANVIDDSIPEGLAEAEARWIMRRAFGVGPASYDEERFSVYDEYAAEALRRFSPWLIHHGQFGANWGADPRQVRWIEPNPALTAETGG